MAMPFGGGGINGTDFSPRSVSLGQSGKIPYINGIDWMGSKKPVQMSGTPAMAPINGAPAMTPNNDPSTLGAESVRATGTGPYDSSYRQNLTTYAGGQFSRPGGSLSFDPTGSLFGNPTGGGNAPVLGMPDSLIGQALGGNPFSFTPPAPAAPPQQDQFTDPLGFWKDQFLNNGRMFGAFNAL